MQDETNETLVFPDHDYPESNIVLVGNVMLIGADADTQRIAELAESLAVVNAALKGITSEYDALARNYAALSAELVNVRAERDALLDGR